MLLILFPPLCLQITLRCVTFERVIFANCIYIIICPDFKMIIPKDNRRKIYEALFSGVLENAKPSQSRIYSVSEGVMVAKKDYNAPKHEDLDVPNLEVIKAMQSLTSKGFVKTQFSWQYYYYTLTTEGLTYFREWYVNLSIIVQLFYVFVKASSPRRNCSCNSQKGRPPPATHSSWRR